MFQLSVLGFMQTLFPLAALANCHCYYHSSLLFYYTVRYFLDVFLYFSEKLSRFLLQLWLTVNTTCWGCALCIVFFRMYCTARNSTSYNSAWIQFVVGALVMLCRVIADHILMVLSSIISINANWCLFCKKWENYFHRFATFTGRICFRNWYSHSLRCCPWKFSLLFFLSALICWW